MIYQIKCDENILFDIREKEFFVEDPILNLEINKVGTLNFSVYPDHPYFDRLNKITSKIEASKNGKVIFRGRIINDSQSIYNCKNIECESALAFLNDSIVKPQIFQGTPSELFTFLINNHNSQVSEDKKIKIGNITVTDANNYIRRSWDIHTKTLELINTRCIDSLGGYIVERYEEDGTYLDWLSDISKISNQTIEFGENLIDIFANNDASNIFSVVIPIGANLEQEDGIFKRITIESVNDNKDYLVNNVALQKYGWIVAPVEKTTWDDVTIPSNLKAKGLDFLNKNCGLISSTLELTALDLSSCNKNIEEFFIYEKINIKSKPHNFNNIYLLKKITIPFQRPQDIKISLGETTNTITGINLGNKQNIDNVIKRVGTIEADYVTNKNLPNIINEEIKENSIIKQMPGQIMQGVETEIIKIEDKIANLSELKATVEGNNELTIEDALEANAIEYRAKGKSEQKTTVQGNNILELSEKYNRYKSATVSYEILSSNSIKTTLLNATGTWSSVSFNVPAKLLSAGAWHLGGKIANFNAPDFLTLTVQLVPKSGGSRTKFKDIRFNTTDVNINKSGNITITEEDLENNNVSVAFYVNGTTLGDTDVAYTSVWENLYLSKVNEFEEFVPDSPSVDYPQKIKSIEGIENLFKPILTQTKSGMTLISNEDGTYTLNGTAIAATSFYVLNVGYKKGTYSFSLNNLQTLNSSNYVQLETNNGNKVLTFATVNNKKVYECDDIKALSIVISSGTVCNNFRFAPMLESGETYHGFVPYGRYLLVNNNSENLFDVNDDRSGYNSASSLGDDDWITISYNNVNGSNNQYRNYYTYPSKLLKPNTDYAIFVEVKEFSGNGGLSVVSGQNAVPMGQFKTNFILSDITVGTYKMILKTREDFSNCESMLRTFFTINAGSNSSITFRISVVENTDLIIEDFEYKPYEQKEILIPLKKENLFNLTSATSYNYSNNIPINSASGMVIDNFTSNSLEFTSASNLYRIALSNIIQLKPNTTYTISYSRADSLIENTQSRFYIYGYSESNYTLLVNNTSDTGNRIYIFTTNESGNVAFGWGYNNNSNGSHSVITDIKIYEGTDTDDYYKLSSIGDVKDELGVINNRVILHKNIGEIILNGSESGWSTDSTGNLYGLKINTIMNITNSTTVVNAICNRYVACSLNSSRNSANGFSFYYSTLYFNKGNFATLEEFKENLSTNNIIVNFELAEPYDVELGNLNIPLRQSYNKLRLVEDLETNTSVTYLRNNVLNEEFARQLDLDITNDNLNSTKNDVNSLNTDIHNSYQDLLSKLNNKVDNEMITQITNRVEETVTSTEWAVNRIQEIEINGAKQVNTGNGMTFNDDGLNFDREGAPVGSSIDEAGTKIVDKTGSSSSILQYTGVVTDEIASEVPTLAKSKGSTVNYAKEYFFSEKIRGKYGQLEEVEDDELGQGWGSFIGGDE